MTSEIRANTLKNRVGLGTVSFTNTGTIVSGIVTANSFSGPLNTTSIDLNGDLDVDGHTNLDNVSIAGFTTITQDLDVDGHTNLDNVSVAGVSTFTGQARFNGEIVAGNVISVQAGGSINIPDKLIHSGDTNTAIRFPAADTFSVETAGSERFRIDSSGNIGAGIAPSSGARLWIATNDNPFVGTRYNAGADGSVLFLQHSRSNTIGAGAALNDNDEVGTVQFRAFASDNSSIKVAALIKAEVNGTTGSGGVPTDLLFGTGTSSGNATERLRITSDGKVGIGEDAPQQKLHLHENSSNGNFMVFTNSTTGVTGNDGCLFGINSDEGGTIWNQENGYIRFGTNDTERLRIDAGGGMQLGTSTATASKLTVYGANDAAAIFQGSGTGTGAGNGFLVGNNGGTAGLLWNYENGDTKFATNNVERLRITSAGNLKMPDAAEIQLGNDTQTATGDLRLFHNGSNSGIINSQGALYIQNTATNSSDLHLQGKSSIQMHCPSDGDVRLHIDSSGRVTLGSGTQSQFASSFNSGANQLLITSNGSTGLTIDSTSSTSSSIHFADGSTGSESYRGIIEYKHSEDDMRFAVEATHVARLRKGSYSDSSGGMIIGNNDDNSGDAHSDSRTLILGATGRSETGMTLITSTSGTGKIRFSDGVQYYNQGAIGYYHNNRTVAQIPTYGESLSFVAAQKENNFVLNGNEAIRVCSDMDRQKMVDGFWLKDLTTSFQTVFSIQSGYDNSSIHRAYFYEIIVYGGDWGSHSANRTYFKGFINGADTYQGHTVIEHSGTYGSNTGGQGHYGSSECQIQVTFTGNGNSHIQMRLSTGSYRAEGYARFIGFIRDYDGFHIR